MAHCRTIPRTDRVAFGRTASGHDLVLGLGRRISCRQGSTLTGPTTLPDYPLGICAQIFFGIWAQWARALSDLPRARERQTAEEGGKRKGFDLNGMGRLTATGMNAFPLPLASRVRRFNSDGGPALARDLRESAACYCDSQDAVTGGGAYVLVDRYLIRSSRME